MGRRFVDVVRPINDRMSKLYSPGSETALAPSFALPSLRTLYGPWDMTIVRQYAGGINIISRGSHRVEGYCSPEPLPAHHCRPLSLMPDSWSLRNPSDIEITKRHLCDIVDKKFDEMSKGCSPNTETVLAPTMPSLSSRPSQAPHRVLLPFRLLLLALQRAAVNKLLNIYVYIVKMCL
jgi:hypothetical protein